VIFHVICEVSLLVEVRLRAALSTPKLTPVANDAPAHFSALSCFSFDNNKTPKQERHYESSMGSLFFCFLLVSVRCSDDAILVFLHYDGYDIMYGIMYAR
jgi:hypothetical protein